MSHWVAVEWDDRMIRVLCVRPSAGTLVIDHRFALPIPGADGTDPTTSATFFPRLAGVLGPALAERGVRKGELLVAIGRTGVELRTIEVPVVPDDELPEFVRLQALQVFHPTAAPSRIDYVPIDVSEEKITVLAASLPAEAYEGLTGLAESLKLKLSCVTLKTVSAARLLAYCGRHPGESLVICRSQEQVDLVAMLEGRPVFIRNTRIPGESIEAALAQEVRRTLLAIASRHSDEQVQRLVLWGSAGESGSLGATLRERLDMEVEVLDPFDAEEVQAGSQRPVEDAGSYAGLVGMLCEHRRPPHAIDFQSPKRRVEPPRISPRVWVYGGAAAAFLLIVGSAFLWKVLSLDAQIRALATDVAELEALKAKADEVIARADYVAEWKAKDYVWLDEMRVVSERMPPAEKAVVQEWVSSVDAEGQGTINLAVYVDAPESITTSELLLRDEYREVIGRGGSPSDALPGYAYLTRGAIKMEQPVPREEERREMVEGEAATAEPIADPPIPAEAIDDVETTEPAPTSPDEAPESTDDEPTEATDPRTVLRSSTPSSTPSSTRAGR